MPYALAPFVCVPPIAHGSIKPALPSRVTPDAAASTASHAQRIATIMIRPSAGRDADGYRSDLGQARSDLFRKIRKYDLTEISRERPSGKSLERLTQNTANETVCPCSACRSPGLLTQSDPIAKRRPEPLVIAGSLLDGLEEVCNSCPELERASVEATPKLER